LKFKGPSRGELKDRFHPAVVELPAALLGVEEKLGLGAGETQQSRGD
jgi:hypothetical protein